MQDWETEVAEFESQTGRAFDEDSKLAVLNKVMPAGIKPFVAMQQTELKTYQQLRSYVVTYLQSKKMWTRADGNKFGAARGSADGPSPMDIGALGGKKGKGKEKGKGKSDKPETCKTCGKNHTGECWYAKQGSQNKEKGKGKGKSEQKGKDSKGKGKKGKGESEKCAICDKAHATKDCWYNAKTQSPTPGKSGKGGKGGKTAAVSSAESTVSINPSDSISNVGALSCSQMMQMISSSRANASGNTTPQKDGVSGITTTQPEVIGSTKTNNRRKTKKPADYYWSTVGQ